VKFEALLVVALALVLAACEVQDTAVEPSKDPQAAGDLEPIAQKPREFTLPATVSPLSNSLPHFGIDVSALSDREAAVVKSAWLNYQRVLDGKEPNCSATYELSDGGSTMYDCGTYELMRMKGLAGTPDKPGYEYGPSLDFLNGHTVERLRFMTNEELERLEGAP